MKIEVVNTFYCGSQDLVDMVLHGHASKVKTTPTVEECVELAKDKLNGDPRLEAVVVVQIVKVVKREAPPVVVIDVVPSKVED